MHDLTVARARAGPELAVSFQDYRFASANCKSTRYGESNDSGADDERFGSTAEMRRHALTVAGVLDPVERSRTLATPCPCGTARLRRRERTW